MAEPSYVDDLADPRLADYVALTDVELRRVKEPAEGMFVAEGDKVIRRALAAGHPLRSMLLAPKWATGLGDVVAAAEAPVLVAGEDLLEAVTGFRVHRGALAAMGRLPLPDPRDLLCRSDRVVVLEDLIDHTNVGAVFRSAAALGMDAALLSPRCADPLYRRAVKVSMGAVFSLPYARLDDWHGAVPLLQEAGLTVLALTPSADAVPLDSLAPERLRRCALLLGAEGPGLSRRWLDTADVAVRIPMSHGIDSLNAAAAAAVACWVVGRARS